MTFKQSTYLESCVAQACLHSEQDFHAAPLQQSYTHCLQRQIIATGAWQYREIHKIRKLGYPKQGTSKRVLEQ